MFNIGVEIFFRQLILMGLVPMDTSLDFGECEWLSGIQRFYKGANTNMPEQSRLVSGV